MREAGLSILEELCSSEILADEALVKMCPYFSGNIGIPHGKGSAEHWAA